MFFAIWAILIFLALGALIKNSRRVLYDDFSTFTSPDEFYKQMERLSRTLVTPAAHGKGVETATVESYINRAYRLIRRRLIRGDELYEFERWLYDNHYLFKRIFGKKETGTFFDLPHAGAVPRVVVLARAIISLSEGNVTRERVDAALTAVNKTSPLTYREIESLDAALSYAILEKLASVSRKCLYYRKMLHVAVRAKNVVKKYATNNLYIYYTVKRNPLIADKLKGFLDEKAVSYDNIDYTFSALIVESNVLTSALVTSLMHLKEITENKYDLMPVVNVLNEDDVYKASDIATQKYYLTEIGRLSDKINLTEDEYARRLLKLAKVAGRDASTLLFEGGKGLEKSVKARATVYCKESKFSVKNAYIVLNIVITLLLSVAAGAASLSLGAGIAVSILGLVGAICPAYFISNKIISAFIKDKPVCKFALSNIPDYARTEVVVPVFIADEKSLRDNLTHIKRLALGNPYDNLRFTLLIDFKASDKEIDEGDGALLDIIKNETPQGVDVAVRRRVPRGKRYGGYERKRGAVMNYAEYLMMGNAENFSYLSADYSRPTFFAVLDADSELAPQAVLSAVNAFLHPINKHYDLLSFECRTNLYDIRGLYSRKFAGEGGRDAYPEYGNFFYKLCGNSIFCGKGIFRLSSYYEKLNNRLPENKILSHDLIEGALLETGSAGVDVYENVPQSFAADEDRRLRWTRGDIQLLPFINITKNSANNEKIGDIYRYLMYVNAFSVFFEPYLLTMLLLAAFTNLPYLAIYAAALFSLKYVVGILSAAFSVFTGKRAEYCLIDIVKALISLVVSAVLLPYKAVVNLAVFVATLFRMTVSKKNLLSWKTFAESKGRDKKDKPLPKKTADKLKSYFEDTYKYFSVAAGAGGLAADHYTVVPKKRAANYTSPTDLGFAILAEACACLTGSKSREEAQLTAFERLNGALSLKKWNGHLYNWYDISTKKPLAPRFVSSVDSGNFIACALTAAGVFGGDFKKKVDEYLATVDFKSLFDGAANMFYIGYNADARRYEGHYDNLVSEARLLCYLGVCFGLPASLWNELSRDYTSLYGNTLLSWGGTAFEYLMPDLFLPPPSCGLLRNTSKNAVKAMRRAKCKGLFGISEGGYFAFDDIGNFRYKAFGVDSLSLKSELNRCVITPYSSFLMLPYARKAVIKNLKKLEGKEAYGDYGFYEAVDFTRSPRLVTQYMSHHQGMTLAAITNALSGNALAKAFEENDVVSSARILLTERQYEGKTQKPEKNKFLYEEKSNAEITVECNKNSAIPRANIIKNGDYSIVIDDFGCGYSSCRGIDVNRFRADFARRYGAFFYVTDDNGNVASPCRAPLNAAGDYKIVFNKSSAEFSNNDAGVSQQIFAPSFFCGELRKLKIVNSDDKPHKYQIAYFSELCLNTRAADIAHRAYSNLFVETEIKDGVLYAVRRSKEKGKGVYAALYVKGADVRYVSNRYNFLGRKNSVANPDYVIKGCGNRDDDNGTVLDPCFAFCGELEVAAGGVYEIEVYTALTDSREKIEAEICRAKNPHFSELVKKIPYVAEYNANYELDGRFTEYLSYIIPKIIYAPYPQEKLYNACGNHILFTEITDNFSRKTMLLKYSGNKRELRQASQLCSLLNAVGISVSLVIWYEEGDSYYTPVRAEIMREVQGVVGKTVHLIESARLDYQTLYGICYTDFSRFWGEYHEVSNPDILSLSPCAFSENPIFETGEGYFAESGYIVNPFGKNTLLPYGNVICGRAGGTIVGDAGGYTYYGNSRESKLTEWVNDFTENAPSERLLLSEDERITDILAGASEKHARGITTYCGESPRFAAKTQIYTVREGGAKVYEVEITAYNRICGSLILNLNLTLGASLDKTYIYYKIEDGVYEAVNLKNGISCYLSAEGAEFTMDLFPFARAGEIFSSSIGDTAYGAAYKVDLRSGEKGKFVFVFGGDFQAVYEAQGRLSEEKSTSLAYFNSLNPCKIKTDDVALDLLFNDCLCYQITSSRVNGRTSPYQAGGAMGFRDILQDALTLIYTDADRAREIILETANHIYVEGDAMHWWHGEKHGVRTRISDDRLFLPYVATEYAQATGDYSIFESEVKYLNSPPLAMTEESRYENPKYCEKTDTLLLHLERIMESAYRMGENGLLLIGGGDWNDALNAVGTATAGESVWLTEMYICAAERMCALYQGKEKLLWLDRIGKLKNAVEKTFTGKQFKRLITAGGEWLGDGYGKECKLDIISQAWAEFATVGDKKYREIALNTAKNLLFDKNNGELLLLLPPFEGGKYYGYISLYPKGIRENGGQYTHGAIWYLSALIKQGRIDEAYQIFTSINPIAKCADKKNALRYMGEPYVLAADVYHNPQHLGRAGWSWYTGSASWCYKLILEGFLGVRLTGGRLEIKPNPPSNLNDITVEYRYKNSLYTVNMVRTGRRAVIENGVELTGDLIIPLRENDRRTITVNF